MPLISRAAVQLISTGLEARLGQAASEQLSGTFLSPIALPEVQQEAICARLSLLVKGEFPDGDVHQWRLSFHRSSLLGFNAFALPGGYISMTDLLVQLLSDEPDAVQGILAHELGHVVRRDGLDLLVRSSLVNALVGVVLGDASAFVAMAPATLATQSYSRDAERADDQFAASLLSANGVSPATTAVIFLSARPTGLRIKGMAKVCQLRLRVTPNTPSASGFSGNGVDALKRKSVARPDICKTT